MTKEDLDKLQVGDLVQQTITGHTFRVEAHHGTHATLVPVLDVRNADDYAVYEQAPPEALGKKAGSQGKPDPPQAPPRASGTRHERSNS